MKEHELLNEMFDEYDANDTSIKFGKLFREIDRRLKALDEISKEAKETELDHSSAYEFLKFVNKRI